MFEWYCDTTYGLRAAIVGASGSPRNGESDEPVSIPGAGCASRAIESSVG